MSKAKDLISLLEDSSEPKKRIKRSKQLIKAEKELRQALLSQEIYMGSVFVNSHGQRKHDDRVAQAYADYHRAGGTLDL